MVQVKDSFLRYNKIEVLDIHLEFNDSSNLSSKYITNKTILFLNYKFPFYCVVIYQLPLHMVFGPSYKNKLP